jgi:hypothetical protein
MRRPERAGWVVAVAVALAVLAVGLPAARADLLQDLGATFDRVARELSDAFPKIETRIAAVEGDRVRLAGGGIAALRPGLELTAYRKGETFRHPITNQPLGQAEEETATLTVTEVAGDTAAARIAASEEGRVPVVGDGVRLTAGRITVAVLPTRGVSVPGETAEQTQLLLVARFSALLERTGRFLTVDAQRVLEVAAPASATAPPEPVEIGRRLRVSGVLVSRVVLEGRVRHLETVWISTRTGATLVSSRMPLVRAIFPPRFAWEQTPELERRLQLDGPVRALALADVDGDGRAEVVLGDDRALTILRWQEGGALVPVEGGELRPSGSILSVDAADLTGLGRAHIVLVEYRGGGEVVRSSVLDYADGRLTTVYQTSGEYLRAVPVGEQTWLLAQRVGETEPFSSTVRRVVWQDGRYADGAALRLPAGVTIYGLAMLGLTGSAEPEVVAVTPEDRLAAWTARGRRLWTSADPFGGAPITFAFTPAREQREQDAIIGRIIGRLVPVQEAPEGPEVLAFENLVPVGGQFRTLLPRVAPLAFTQGRIHRMRWKDGAFTRVWQSRETEGYIVDFALGDLDGDGVAEVVVAVVPRGLTLDTTLGRPRAHLVFYELP